MMTTKLNKAQLEFVEKITKSLDEGIVPWRATWEQPIEMPYNASTNTSYKGLNLLSLWITQNRQHFDDPRWMTFKQANDLGYKIKPGSKGTSISYWSLKNIKTDKLVTKEEYNEMTEEEREDIFPVSKSYVVFNAAQISGIPELTKEERKEVIFENEKARSFADRMRENMDLEVLHRGSSAYYSPTEDQVVLPPMDSFMDEQAYYATYLHEMAHATSHPNRLSRKIDGTFGTSEYAEEELRAEITASFLSLDIGFHFTEFHERNHQSYIRSWSQKIKDNPSVIFNAIKEAQEIREYMLEKGEYELIYQQGQEKKMSQPLPSAQITKETLENPQEREVNDIQKYAIYKESTEKDFDDEIKNGNWNGFRLAEYRTEEGQDISYHGSPLYSTIHQFTDLESGKEYRYDDADRFARKNIVFHEIENNKVDLSDLKQRVKNNIDELQKEVARLNEQMQNIEKAEVVFNDLIHGSTIDQFADSESKEINNIDNIIREIKSVRGDYKGKYEENKILYYTYEYNDHDQCWNEYRGYFLIDNKLFNYFSADGWETNVKETTLEEILKDYNRIKNDKDYDISTDKIDQMQFDKETNKYYFQSQMAEKKFEEIEMPKENYEPIKENNILEKEAPQAAQEQTDNPSVQTAVQTEEPLERSLESSTPSVEESPQKAKSKKEQLEDMKNSVSIAEYARDVLGYHLVRMGRGKMGLEEFESCVIYPNNTFYRFSVGVGGSIIDFIKLCEECDTREAIHKLENYYYQYSPEKRFDTNENLKEYNYKKTMLEGISVPERNSTNKHVYSYLTKTRCIKPSIVNDYLKRHLLYEDTHKNCVFLGKLDNTILYGFSRSTGEKRFTQDLNGSIKEVGIYVDNNSDVLVVNEAVIDQMSYMSMLKNPQKFNYLSVNGAGNAVNAVRFHMKKRPEAKQLSSVIIGLDNDEAGIENTEKLIEYLKKENPNIEVLVHQPTAKDFNEQLQNEMQVLANAAPSAEEALAAV